MALIAFVVSVVRFTIRRKRQRFRQLYRRGTGVANRSIRDRQRDVRDGDAAQRGMPKVAYAINDGFTTHLKSARRASTLRDTVRRLRRTNPRLMISPCCLQIQEEVVSPADVTGNPVGRYEMGLEENGRSRELIFLTDLSLGSSDHHGEVVYAKLNDRSIKCEKLSR